jgi:FAD/FMN-containing dehydrogenase
VRPATPAESARVLAVCHAHGQAVVPQGGMTGLVGGGAPRDGDVVLSLERLTRVEDIDRDGLTLTAEAGVVLQTAQERCAEADLELPVDLGARGSATIGGLIATNAGGVRVIRHGMMRDSVLGLEAVLADGTVLSSMNRMLKNNVGYDLKQVFIGSEGTLGVVTRAVIRLRPRSKQVTTAIAAAPTVDTVIGFLGLLHADMGDDIASFEVMWPEYDAFVRARCPNLRPPLSPGLGFAVLVETLTESLVLERVLAAALRQGLIVDATVAKNERERAAFWAVREGAGEGMRALGPYFVYDVSMPIATMETFGTPRSPRATRRPPSWFWATWATAICMWSPPSVRRPRAIIAPSMTLSTGSSATTAARSRPSTVSEWRSAPTWAGRARRPRSRSCVR